VNSEDLGKLRDVGAWGAVVAAGASLLPFLLFGRRKRKRRHMRQSATNRRKVRWFTAFGIGTKRHKSRRRCGVAVIRPYPQRAGRPSRG
jgi:hypothetical protein